jgi:hypothetical protein
MKAPSQTILAVELLCCGFYILVSDNFKDVFLYFHAFVNQNIFYSQILDTTYYQPVYSIHLYSSVQTSKLALLKLSTV